MNQPNPEELAQFSESLYHKIKFEDEVTISDHFFNQIYDAIRLTNNIYETYKRETAYDRTVDNVWQKLKNII